jgi:hypothetical protein
VGVSESAHFGGRSGYLCPFFTQKSINPVEASSPKNPPTSSKQ